MEFGVWGSEFGVWSSEFGVFKPLFLVRVRFSRLHFRGPGLDLLALASPLRTHVSELQTPNLPLPLLSSDQDVTVNNKERQRQYHY